MLHKHMQQTKIIQQESYSLLKQVINPILLESDEVVQQPLQIVFLKLMSVYPSSPTLFSITRILLENNT